MEAPPLLQMGKWQKNRRKTPTLLFFDNFDTFDIDSNEKMVKILKPALVLLAALLASLGLRLHLILC